MPPASSDRQLRRRVQSGFLEPIGLHDDLPLPATAAVDSPSSPALVLDVGQPSGSPGPRLRRCTGSTGSRYAAAPPHRAADRNVRRIGVASTPQRLCPRSIAQTFEGLPVTSPARTIVDLASTEPPDAPRGSRRFRQFETGCAPKTCCTGASARSVDQRRFGVPKLLDVLDGREVTRGGQQLARAASSFASLDGSPTAVDLRPNRCSPTWPESSSCASICRFPGTNVVVELLGYRSTDSVPQLVVDAARLNAARARRLRAVPVHLPAAMRRVVHGP